MFDTLNTLLERFNFLTLELAKPEVINNIEQYTSYTCELASIKDIVDLYNEYLKAKKYLDQLFIDINDDTDIELKELCKLEISDTKNKLESLENDLKYALLPKDENDDKNVVMEIRAGVGGDEACIFANDLFLMYDKYAQKQGWKVKIASAEEGTCGIKEIILLISGNSVYSKLKYEAGVHRVQRVPDTEAKGRIHTSTATVAVMPERDAIEVNIDMKDIRIDLYHSSGKGGQNVNKVESAVRVTHLPTGIVVACQEERSQLMNKERAFDILRARLFDYYNQQEQEQAAANKKSMIGSGDRSEKIRTYNYPQSRVTDHRINFSIYDLEKFMQGNIDEMIEQLIMKDKELLLANFNS